MPGNQVNICLIHKCQTIFKVKKSFTCSRITYLYFLQFDLHPMINAGVCGFKCFLIESGVDEFPPVTEEDLHKAMKQLQGTNSVLMVW